MPRRHILDALEADERGDSAAVLRALSLAFTAASKAQHQQAVLAATPRLTPFTGSLRRKDDAKA